MQFFVGSCAVVLETDAEDWLLHRGWLGMLRVLFERFVWMGFVEVGFTNTNAHTIISAIVQILIIAVMTLVNPISRIILDIILIVRLHV